MCVCAIPALILVDSIAELTPERLAETRLAAPEQIGDVLESALSAEPPVVPIRGQVPLAHGARTGPQIALPAPIHGADY